jgi:hypothetical protein
MKAFVALAACLCSGLTAVSPMAAAAPPPVVSTGDSVTATGTSTVCGGPLEINAQSGPSGENPTGQITGACPISGPITCLDVRTTDAPGTNFARLAVVGATGPTGPILLTVLTGTLGFGVGVLDGSDCTQLPGTPFDLGFTGSIQIIDSDRPPLPTLAGQCKNSGWRTFGVFNNQGDCVSFVATGGKNQPAGRGNVSDLRSR